MRFLLERLAAPPEAARGLLASFDLEAAVAAQIQRIVSTRPRDPDDEAGSLLGYGMPNVVELARDNKDELECYAARLRKMIARYEPRLRHPEVAIEAVQEGLSSWRLVVSGSLTPDDEAHTFRFEL